MNSPKEIAVAYCAAGEAKTKLPAIKTFVLAIPIKNARNITLINENSNP